MSSQFFDLMWVLELKGGQSERSDKKNSHVDGNIHYEANLERDDRAHPSSRGWPITLSDTTQTIFTVTPNASIAMPQ